MHPYRADEEGNAMLENIIPVLISGAFSIISILVGKSLLTDPLQSIEAKQELLNKHQIVLKKPRSKTN